MTGMDGINSLQKVLGSLQTNDSASVNAASTAKADSASASAVTASGVDSAKLSAAGLASQATDTSDVRMDKVAALQQAIAGGTYNVSASDVANKMVESLLK